MGKVLDAKNSPSRAYWMNLRKYQVRESEKMGETDEIATSASRGPQLTLGRASLDGLVWPRWPGLVNSKVGRQLGCTGNKQVAWLGCVGSKQAV